jgi:signal transduction histidine kinase
MSRLDSDPTLNLATTDINSRLRLLCANLQEVFDRKGVGLTLAPADGPLRVHCDASQLIQAVTNLLDNALRYTPSGGSVTVVAERCAGRVVISVQDTGIGMTLEQQQRAFERFYRADEAHSTRGFGLGLSIVQRIIELHGGSVSVDSTPGVGSIFSLSLPAGPVESQGVLTAGENEFHAGES